LVGRTLMLDKRFVAGVGALWFYDYFLTLADEIEYAWSGKASLIFVLFILNRYWPLWYLLWLFVAYWSPEFTKPMCDKTAWFYNFYVTFSTVFAQVVMTLRIYAVTRNNRWIASYLSFITFAQFAFGLYLMIRFATRPAVSIPNLPFDEFQFCLFQQWKIGEIIYALYSVVYDTSAFAVIIYSARNRSLMRVDGVQSLLDTIVEDATVYFLVIFAGQLLVVFFEIFAPETIQLLPGSGIIILGPMMITRLILSLRKAVNSVSNGAGQLGVVRFAQHTVGGSERIGGGDMALRNISSEGTSVLPRSNHRI